jgi:hypothetical protein
MQMSDDLTVTNKEAEAPDTYHDQDKLMRISGNANRMSLFFLVLFLIVVILLGIILWWYISGRATLDQFIYYFLIGLVPLFLGGFFWIALGSISEGIYLLMDLEDNTRHNHNPI